MQLTFIDTFGEGGSRSKVAGLQINMSNDRACTWGMLNSRIHFNSTGYYHISSCLQYNPVTWYNTGRYYHSDLSILRTLMHLHSECFPVLNTVVTSIILHWIYIFLKSSPKSILLSTITNSLYQYNILPLSLSVSLSPYIYYFWRLGEAVSHERNL